MMALGVIAPQLTCSINAALQKQPVGALAKKQTWLTAAKLESCCLSQSHRTEATVRWAGNKS